MRRRAATVADAWPGQHHSLMNTLESGSTASTRLTPVRYAAAVLTQQPAAAAQRGVHMHRSLALKSLAAALVAVASLAPVPSAAQTKKLVLRVADQFPQGHFLPRYGIKPWMEQVTKASNGEVQFEYYPSEQLGKAKDLLSLVQTGRSEERRVGKEWRSRWS